MWIYGLLAVTQIVEPKQPDLRFPEAVGKASLYSFMSEANGIKQLNFIEVMVDHKLKQMEERVLKHIDEKLNNLQIKIEAGNSQLTELISAMKNK